MTRRQIEHGLKVATDVRRVEAELRPGAIVFLKSDLASVCAVLARRLSQK